MTHAISVAALNGVGFRQDEPREGTHRRAIFDLLAPACVVSTEEILAAAPMNRSTVKTFIEQMAITYDLDVRYFGRGRWCRVGEWKGRKYIDHLASIARAL